MTILANCPACRHVRQVQDHDLCLGVMCPYCHNAYMDAVARPRSDTETAGPPLSSSSYAVDVGHWFSYASAHWTSIIGPAIGFLLIQMVATMVVMSLQLIPVVGLVLSLVASLTGMPLLEAGVIYVTLAQLKGDRWTFGDFFAAFRSRYLWPIMVFTWIMAGIILVVLTPCWVPVLVGTLFGVEQLVWFGVVSLIIFGPVAMYVGVRIGFFGPHLILDRDFGPLEAVQESWDLTTGHFLGLFGVALLLGALNLLGAVFFGVGLLLVAPLTALVRSAGYLLAGGTRPPMKQPELD
jgi:hypothetical protein